MTELVYPRERTLGAITLVLGLLGWLLLVVGTFGVALVGLLFGFVIYLFAQSALIAHIKGNGVELSEQQFPELFQQFTACCDTLGIATRPEAYILNGNGGLNAFATKFLGTQFVVLLSDVVDAMDEHPDGVRFYIGHELGHLRMGHLRGHLLRWPVLWLPLLGAAYARAKESTCDRHGLACSASPEGAARALAALSTGARRWRQLDLAAYVRQSAQGNGFWMSFHELIGGYPWLNKRAARVLEPQAAQPSRNPLSYVLALFVPYAGQLGAGFGMLIVVYIIGVLAAMGIPAYQEYVQKSALLAAYQGSEPARAALGQYYEAHAEVPATLQTAGIAAEVAGGSTLALDPKRMVLTVTTLKQLELVFTPSRDESGHISWHCSGGEGVSAKVLPKPCKQIAAE